jgi:hypothetical protein
LMFEHASTFNGILIDFLHRSEAVRTLSLTQ